MERKPLLVKPLTFTVDCCRNPAEPMKNSSSLVTTPFTVMIEPPLPLSSTDVVSAFSNAPPMARVVAGDPALVEIVS